MAFLVIDTSLAQTSRFFEQTVQLEGFEYLFRFLWSDRESRWYLNLYDQDGNPIALGVGIKVAWPLLRRFKDTRLPAGMLIAVDVTGKRADVSYATELGARVKLMYVTSDDPALA